MKHLLPFSVALVLGLAVPFVNASPSMDSNPSSTTAEPRPIEPPASGHTFKCPSTATSGCNLTYRTVNPQTGALVETTVNVPKGSETYVPNSFPGTVTCTGCS